MGKKRLRERQCAQEEAQGAPCLVPMDLCLPRGRAQLPLELLTPDHQGATHEQCHGTALCSSQRLNAPVGCCSWPSCLLPLGQVPMWLLFLLLPLVSSSPSIPQEQYDLLFVVTALGLWAFSTPCLPAIQGLALSTECYLGPWESLAGQCFLPRVSSPRMATPFPAPG